MKTMTIHRSVEVFFDPEFCETDDIDNPEVLYSRCDYLNIHRFTCNQFPSKEQKSTILEDSTVDSFGSHRGRAHKCQQCKDLFKQSLSEEKNAQRIHKNSP